MAKVWAATAPRLLLVWAGVIAIAAVALRAGLTELPDPVAWQVRADRWVPERPDVRRIEQAFTPGRDGLAGVDIRLNPAAAGGIRALTVRLTTEADGREVASARVTAGPSVPATARVRFDPQPESSSRVYRLVVSAADGGALPPGLLAATGEEAYPEGRLMADDTPVAGSLYFRAYYRPGLDRLGAALVGALRDLPALTLAAGLWLLPGLALSLLLGWPENPDLVGRVAAGSSFSLAFWPLIYYWAGLGGLPAFETGLGVGVGLVGAARLRRRAAGSFRSGQTGVEPGPAVLLGLILGLTLLVRLYPLSDLALTPWVDGPHHALVVRKISEANRVPDAYGPEVDLPAFYHFGFHVQAAVLARLTGADPVGTTGLTGQLLSAWAAVLGYWLVREWSGSPAAGLVGAGLAGLVMTFPGYFLSWSRFSLAGGLDLLPATLVAGRDSVRSARAAVGLGVLLAGLAVTHYRLLALAGLSVGVLVVLTARATGPAPWKRILLALAAFGPALPWLATAAGRFGVAAVGASLAGAVGPEPFPWDLVVRWPDGVVFLLAVPAVLLGLGRRRPDALALGLTVLAAGFLANALPVRSPLPGIVDGVTVASTLWLAALVPAGIATVRIVGAVAARLGLSPGPRLVGAIVLVVGCAQVGRQLGTVNPDLVLVHPADLPALRWVRANTPADAGFLINVFEWRPGFHAGSDAGFWVPAVAGRPTLIPTLLYGNLPAEEFARRNRIARELLTGRPDWDRLIPELRALGIGYVFIGRRGGPVTASALLGRSEFYPVYHQAGVWVFAVRPP